MAAVEHETDVCVVGAGPTGLMAANWLERLGVDALVLDGKPGPTRESRALGLQSRTMEIYAQLGVIDEVLARAVPATEVRPGVGPSALGAVPLDRIGQGITKYPGLNILEQSANEEILADRLTARGRGVLWNHTLASAVQDAERVELHCQRPNGESVTIRARYVIAADGASSSLRGMLGIGFRGATNAHFFYVVDANDVHGTGSGINVRMAAENFMLSFPMAALEPGKERVRLLGILREEADDGGAAGQRTDGLRADVGHVRDGAGDLRAGDRDGADERRARTSLQEEFGISYGSSGWFATYRVHHRVAECFRSGRIFLAGDAGHVHSPVGAQGMNTGLQDAHNLACKLADVLAGRMPASYLDRYEAERRPVALRLVTTTDRLFAAVTSGTALARFLRTRVLPVVWPVVIPLVPRSPAGGRLFGYLSQIRIHYWMSEGERRRAEALRGPARWRRRGRVLGRRLPWIGAVHPGEDNHAPLADATWQVHAYGPRAAGLGAERAAEHGLPLHRFSATSSLGLPDGTVVVVRPDMFVATLDRAPGRWPQDAAGRGAGRA